MVWNKGHIPWNKGKHDNEILENVHGIYKIQSKIKPERIYIGSAVNIYKRWCQHLYYLRNRKHHSQKLQRHYNTYKEDDLIFSIIYDCEKEDLIEKEQYFLDKYKPYFNNSMNANSQLGMKHTEATKGKISLSKKGSDYWTGRKHREESKEKMRIAHLGRKASNETKKKLSLARIGNQNAKGNKNRLGKSSSKETRKKISISLRGRKRPDISESQKGRKLDIKHKNNISEGLKKYWDLRKTIRNHGEN